MKLSVLLRSILLSVVLILFVSQLTTASSFKTAATKNLNNAKEKVLDKANEMKEEMIDIKDSTKEKIYDKAEEIKLEAGDLAEKAKEKMQNAGENLKERAEEGAHKMGEFMADKTKDIRKDLKNKAQDLKETLKVKAEDVKEDVKEKAQNMGEYMADKTKDIRKDLKNKAQDAKETVQECVSEFISFITSEASEKCQQEKRKTINGDDILWAMRSLGFDNYNEPLKVYIHKYRESTPTKRTPKQEEKAGGNSGSSGSSSSTTGSVASTQQPAIDIPITYPTYQMYTPHVTYPLTPTMTGHPAIVAAQPHYTDTSVTDSSVGSLDDK